MRKVINKLKNEANAKEAMLGATAPSNWDKSQEEWVQKEEYEIKQLRKAARILEATL